MIRRAVLAALVAVVLVVHPTAAGATCRHDPAGPFCADVLLDPSQVVDLR